MTPLSQEDVTSVLGVRVTTPARSLVDVTRTTGRLDQIERGIEEALERRLVTEAALRSTVERSSLSPTQRAWFKQAVAAAAQRLSQ
jgi:hypothetical protein